LALLSGGFSVNGTDDALRMGAHLACLTIVLLAKWIALALARKPLFQSLISTGGLNRNYYISVAAALGYTIYITQFRPAMCGMSVCGDAINGDEWPFTWQINVPGTTIRYAYSGSTYCGDPLGSWGDKQFECAITKIAPSHINIIFVYGFEAEINTPEYQSLFDVLMNSVWPEY
jgi:hypothetical protein